MRDGILHRLPPLASHRYRRPLPVAPVRRGVHALLLTAHGSRSLFGEPDIHQHRLHRGVFLVEVFAELRAGNEIVGPEVFLEV